MNVFSNKEWEELKIDIEKERDYSPITWICEFKGSVIIFTADSIYKPIRQKEEK